MTHQPAISFSISIHFFAIAPVGAHLTFGNKFHANNPMPTYFRILTAFASCHLLIGCALYSPELAPYEPKIHNVGVGDFIDLENSGGGIYIEEITSTGIKVSRRNGYGGWKLSDGSNSMGNGESLEIVTFDPRAGSATIKQTEIDRRGFDGAFAF